MLRESERKQREALEHQIKESSKVKESNNNMEDLREKTEFQEITTNSFSIPDAIPDNSGIMSPVSTTSRKWKKNRSKTRTNYEEEHGSSHEREDCRTQV